MHSQMHLFACHQVVFYFCKHSIDTIKVSRYEVLGFTVTDKNVSNMKRNLNLIGYLFVCLPLWFIFRYAYMISMHMLLATHANNILYSHYRDARVRVFD